MHSFVCSKVSMTLVLIEILAVNGLIKLITCAQLKKLKLTICPMTFHALYYSRGMTKFHKN